MSIEVTISPASARAASEAIRRTRSEQMSIIEREFVVVSPRLISVIQLHTPVGATAALRDSTRAEVHRFPDSVELRIIQDARNPRNNFPYLPAVLRGRRAGARPPSGDLIPWVRRKLQVPEERVRLVAWRIARAIGRKGTRPQPYYLEVVRDSIPLFEDVANRTGQQLVVILTKF